MKRTRRRLTGEERADAAAFKAAVTGARCGCCGLMPMFSCSAHHVVEKQELKRRGLPLYDVRNVFPICQDCHERHTNASGRIPFRKLSAENIAYAYEALGDYAFDYLRRRYPTSEAA